MLELKKYGASLRQISRLTGISLGVVRGITQGTVPCVTKDSLTSKGWNVSTAESRVMVGNGKYRYPDIIAKKGGVTRYYQIGRRTLSGNPIAREIRALRDLGSTGKSIFFVPYN